MNEYTIYCTSEQTRKAFELGAPIEKDCSAHLHDPDRTTYIDDCSYCKYYCNPTAEQMIGWLEEQEGGTLCINLRKEGGENGHYNFTFWIRNAKTDKLITTFGGYHSLKKVTLAAIDAALEYLSNNK